MDIEFLWKIILPILTALLGYVVGTLKSFKEAKYRAYEELLPPIVKFTYRRENTEDEKEFSRALCKVWLFANKRVTNKIENLCKIIHKDITGDETSALQEAINEMRNDIQLWTNEKLDPKKINHIYTIITSEPKRNINWIQNYFDGLSFRIDSCISGIENDGNLPPEKWEEHKREINSSLEVLSELWPSTDGNNEIKKMAKNSNEMFQGKGSDKEKQLINCLLGIKKNLQIMIGKLV